MLNSKKGLMVGIVVLLSLMSVVNATDLNVADTGLTDLDGNKIYRSKESMKEFISPSAEVIREPGYDLYVEQNGELVKSSISKTDYEQLIENNNDLAVTVYTSQEHYLSVQDYLGQRGLTDGGISNWEDIDSTPTEPALTLNYVPAAELEPSQISPSETSWGINTDEQRWDFLKNEDVEKLKNNLRARHYNEEDIAKFVDNLDNRNEIGKIFEKNEDTLDSLILGLMGSVSMPLPAKTELTPLEARALAYVKEEGVFEYEGEKYEYKDGVLKKKVGGFLGIGFLAENTKVTGDKFKKITKAADAARYNKENFGNIRLFVIALTEAGYDSKEIKKIKDNDIKAIEDAQAFLGITADGKIGSGAIGAAETKATLVKQTAQAAAAKKKVEPKVEKEVPEIKIVSEKAKEEFDKAQASLIEASVQATDKRKTAEESAYNKWLKESEAALKEPDAKKSADALKKADEKYGEAMKNAKIGYNAAVKIANEKYIIAYILKEVENRGKPLSDAEKKTATAKATKEMKEMQDAIDKYLEAEGTVSDIVAGKVKIHGKEVEIKDLKQFKIATAKKHLEKMAKQREGTIRRIMSALNPGMASQAASDLLKNMGKYSFLPYYALDCSSEDLAGWQNTLCVVSDMADYANIFCDKSTANQVSGQPGTYTYGGEFPSYGDFPTIYVNGRRTDYAGDMSWGVEYSPTTNPKWFPSSTDYETASPLGYLYTFSWYIKNPYSQAQIDEMPVSDRLSKGLDKDGNITYTVKLSWKEKPENGQVSKGNKKLYYSYEWEESPIPPGGEGRNTPQKSAGYLWNYFDEICIYFDAYRYGNELDHRCKDLNVTELKTGARVIAYECAEETENEDCALGEKCLAGKCVPKSNDLTGVPGNSGTNTNTPEPGKNENEMNPFG